MVDIPIVQWLKRGDGGSGGGGGPKPAYLLSDGDTISTTDSFYFNTEFSNGDYNGIGEFLEDLTYVTDPFSGLGVCSLGIGYFYAVDLTNAGASGEYAIVWNDGTITVIYSTTAISIPGVTVTEAGWQVASYSPPMEIVISASDILPAFAAIMDEVIAKDDIAFGIKKVALEATENGTYVATGGTLYGSVSVSVSSGESKPQLNAPTISISGTQLTITDSPNNGSFVEYFDIYLGGTLYTSTQSTSVSLSGATSTEIDVTVKCRATNFQDSPASVAETLYAQYTVSFYDGASQMTGSPVTVAYGSTISQAITTGSIDTMKSGYEFDGWYSDNSLTTEVSISTTVSSNITIYGKWTEGISFARSPWSDIVDICDAGQASTTFTIGDTRDVVGSNNNTYRLRIIDFGHDDLSNNQGKASMSIQISFIFGTTEYMYAPLPGVSSTYTPAQAEFTSSTPVTIKNGVYAVLNALPSEIGQSAKSVTKKVAYNNTYKTDDFIAFPLSPYEIAVSPKFSNGSYTNDGTIYEYYKNNSFPIISGNSSKHLFRGLGSYGSSIAHSYYQVSDGTFRNTNSNTQPRSSSMPIVFCI